MDAETERNLAAIIMAEASRLRSDAERDGVAAYLAKPTVRSRANSQFLRATVRSVQQSNRIVEVNEMWRRRNVELEREQERKRHWRSTERSAKRRLSASERQRARDCEPEASRDDGLNDDELEEFLNSRLKRGRGATGSRMDEPGPYPRSEGSEQVQHALMPDERLKHEWEDRIVGRGPVTGPSLSADQMGRWKRRQRDSSGEAAVDEEFPPGKEEDRANKKIKKKQRREEDSKRDSKRDSKKNRRKKLEKCLKRRK